MKARWAAALLAVLVLPLLPLPGAQAAGAPLEWWGPKAIDEGFHMRVPVAVSNPHGFPVSNAPVAAELDLASLLIEAGWIKAAGGDRDLLAGFRLDQASIRVVSMTNLLPADNVNGRLRVADATFPPGDDRRFEVPSLHIEGSLAGAASFDASVNPRITVLWRVPGTLQPGESRSFVVYFDSDRSAEPKAPRANDLTLADGDLQSLFWSGATLNAFGYVQPPPGAPGRIQVTALHAQTTVHVLTAPVGAVGAPAAPLQPLAGGNVFQLAAEGTVEIPVTTAGPVVVQVLSNKPVIATGISMGFIPSLDGGMTGREFLFRTTTPLDLRQDVLYVKALDPRDDDGLLEPTTLEVRALPAGPTYKFQTGSGANPFDYTATARAGIEAGQPGCWGDRPSPTITDNLASHPRLYQARVTSGERVMLQLLPVGGLSQVPSAIGAPAGTGFWAAGPWSSVVFPPLNAPCKVATTAAAWVAAGTTRAGSANVTSPEVGYQLSPPGAPSPPGPPQGRYPDPQPVPAAPAFSSVATISRRVATDRPVLYQSSEEAWLFAGKNPATLENGANFNGPPQVHGPLGGMGAGRQFAGLGRSVVFAPFQGTVLEVRSQYFQGSDTKVIPLAEGTFRILDDRSASNPLRSFALDANRPVLVNPAGAVSSGFFAGLPAMLVATPGKAEYRGYLLDLASENGLDPLTGSTAPGTPIAYKVRLSNRARALDGGALPDLVRLTAQLPPGWSAALEGNPLSATEGLVRSLPGGDTRLMTLVVTPPASLGSGASGTVRLTATSQNNERVGDTLDIVTYVKTTFEVGLWFDAVGGPKSQENNSLSNDRANFVLVVQNKGSRPETVVLSTRFRNQETTWLALLGGPDGAGEMRLPLGPLGCKVGSVPCDQAKVTLTMQAPAGQLNVEATVVVRAEIEGITGSGDAVQATAAMRAPSDLVLEPDGLTRFVEPSGNATFNLTLRNRGEGPAAVTLDARASSTPGWAAPRLLVQGEANRTSVTVAPATAGGPGETRIQVIVPAKATALAGQSTTVRFSARVDGSSTGGLVEAVLFGTIKPVHRIEATLPNLPIGLVAGDNVTLEVHLANGGNLDERFLVRAADLPPGWSIDAPTEVLVPRNATVELRLAITVPPGEPPAARNVTVDLVAHDGNVTSLGLPVEVGLGVRSSASAAAPRAAQPGRTVRVEVPVANDGNTPLEVAVARATGEPWALVGSPPIRLLPGERSSVAVAWQVPADASDGASLRRALLTFAPEGLEEPRSEVVSASIDVGRADLRVQDLRAVAAPAGTLVQANVTNAGTRSGLLFAIDLIVDGEAVDRVQVGELPPAGSLQVALLQTRPGTARVVVDADGIVVESDERNNEATLPEAGGQDAPAAAFVPAALLALAAAWLRRRWA